MDELSMCETFYTVDQDVIEIDCVEINFTTYTMSRTDQIMHVMKQRLSSNAGQSALYMIVDNALKIFFVIDDLRWQC